MKSVFQKLATLLVTLTLCLLIGEVGLRILTPFPARQESNTVGHPDLGFLMNPSLAEIDSDGFRNPPGTRENAEIAIIGDSHTYGYNATSEDSYPAVVARKSGEKTYNFGIGGYGIYQYKVLLDQLTHSDFKTVVLGFYLRNDLYTSCKETQTDYWQRYATENHVVLPPCRGKAYPTGVRGYARKIADFFKYSATNDAIRVLIWQRIKEKWFDDTEVNKEQYFLFPGGYAIRRDFYGDLLQMVDLENSTVAETFRNTEIFLREAHTQLASRKIDFLVLLIPSKSQVLQAWAVEQGFALEPGFIKGVTMQDALRREFIKFLTSEGIDYMDASPRVVAAFKKSLEAGVPFYPATDGHPYAVGYEAYADAVLDGLALTRQR